MNFKYFLENYKVNADHWYHGDQSKRSDFCNQNMDRDTQVAEANARGPGIYLTSDIDQANRYAYPNGYMYTVKIDTSRGRVISDDDKSSKNKKFLFSLIKKAQLLNVETAFYGVSNYAEVSDVSDVKDQHFINIINNYLSKETFIDSCLTVEKEFFQDSNQWTKSMVELGVIGYIHEFKGAGISHFIIYDCNVIKILAEKSYGVVGK